MQSNIQCVCLVSVVGFAPIHIPLKYMYLINTNHRTYPPCILLRHESRVYGFAPIHIPLKYMYLINTNHRTYPPCILYDTRALVAPRRLPFLNARYQGSPTIHIR